MKFRDKVRKPKRPVVVYEILPPREKDGTLNSYAERISSLLSQTHIDAINIPEVHDEDGRGARPIKNLERAESHFLTAIRISPDYSDAYMALGDMYSRTGKIDQAL